MTITESTARQLLMDSGGYCANPECRLPLYVAFGEQEVSTVYDMAHIIARSHRGPRGREPMPELDRDEYANLILLCPRCHRLVDSNPSQYPSEVLTAWKREHVEIVEALLAPEVASRDELRRQVAPPMRENRAIHSAFGPESDHPPELQEEAAAMWRRQVLAVILPNNRRIYALLKRNADMLEVSEGAAVQDFYAHMIAFEYNQLSGDKTPVAPTYPVSMEDILGGI